MASQAAAAIVLRPMTAADINFATELSREQSWPHKEEDWEFFQTLGEGIVAECDGDVVGTIMAWRFGADYAAIGMVIVSNRMQGQGLGRRLMEDMIDRLDGRSIVLNATVEGLPLYTKLGFEQTGVILQHQAIAPAMPLAELRPDERVRPASATEETLGELYSQAAGMNRQALFDALVAEGETVVLTHDLVPQGFAQIRHFGRGWLIGPVVAPDQAGAKALILHWLGTKSGKFCRLDVTQESGLSPWLEEIGLPRVGEVVTMVRGKVPVGSDGAQVMALAAQALG